MAQIEANRLNFEFELTGPEHAPVILLIMGLGMQLIAWPADLLKRFHQAGFRTLVYDQRDVGLSSHMDRAGRPSFVWIWLKSRLGLKVTPPYSIADLAEDARLLTEALGIDSMHVIGISMGGMVAQHLAVQNNERVLSLALLMSTSGARELPSADREVSKLLLGRMPERTDEAALVERFVCLFQLIGSPKYPTSEEVLRERARASVRRAATPDGTARQVLAIFADGDRSAILKRIDTPTLVIHGAADPLLPPPCGRDLAEKIPGAQLIIIDGMGHDLPDALIPRLADLLIAHVKESPSS